LNWLAFEDPAMLPIKDTDASTLIERYALAVLYFSTGGPQWASSVNFLSNDSVCDWKDGRNEVRCFGSEPKVASIYIGEPSLCVTVLLESKHALNHFISLTLAKMRTISTAHFLPNCSQSQVSKHFPCSRAICMEQFPKRLEIFLI
jgi:hypothetical protein